jgi:hypothetical protein
MSIQCNLTGEAPVKLRLVSSVPNQKFVGFKRWAKHPKLAVTAVGSTEGFAAKPEAMRERSAKAVEFRKISDVPPANSTEERAQGEVYPE